jgi:hypothetical protein
MKNLTNKENITPREIRRVSFNATDARGRQHGVDIEKRECVFTDAGHCEYGRGAYSIEVGHYFTLHMMGTRDGVKFGPMQPTKYFKTEEERELYIEKRLPQD